MDQLYPHQCRAELGCRSEHRNMVLIMKTFTGCASCASLCIFSENKTSHSIGPADMAGNPGEGHPYYTIVPHELAPLLSATDIALQASRLYMNQRRRSVPFRRSSFHIPCNSLPISRIRTTEVPSHSGWRLSTCSSVSSESIS